MSWGGDVGICHPASFAMRSVSIERMLSVVTCIGKIVEGNTLSSSERWWPGTNCFHMKVWWWQMSNTPSSVIISLVDVHGCGTSVIIFFRVSSHMLNISINYRCFIGINMIFVYYHRWLSEVRSVNWTKQSRVDQYKFQINIEVSGRYFN